MANVLVGGYVRLSNDPDGTSDSTERQLLEIEKQCKSRGWAFEGTYRDSDLSGYKRKVVRPDFERMLLDLESGRINTVVVWKIDRFTRHPAHLERFITMAERTGSKVVSLTEPFDMDNSMGLFMLRMMVNNAHLASAQTGERVRNKNAFLASKGEPSASPVPFGYNPDRRTLHPVESDLLRSAYRAVLAGQSLTSITRGWNAAGIRTRQGKLWRSTTLRPVLLRARNAGYRVHQGEIVGDATWEPVIDRETFHEAEAVLTDPARRQSHSYAVAHLLAGLAYCQCGARMTPHSRGTGQRSYACQTAHGGCGRVSCTAPALEAAVATEFVAIAGGVRAPEPATPDNRAALRQAEQALAELAEMLGAGEFTRAEYVAARRPLAERVEALKKVASVPVVRRPDAVDLVRDWNGMPLDVKRRHLGAWIEKVVISPATRRGPQSFGADRYRVVWR